MLSLADPQQVTPQLSVIIVNFNAGALLARAVEAVLVSCDSVEVLVCDNGSTDNSLRQLEERSSGDSRVRILHNQANLGFASASNRALSQAVAPYVLFLNPDCIVAPDTLAQTLLFMGQHPDAGMVGCVIRNPDGSEQIASRRLIPDPWVAALRFTGIYRLWPGLSARLGLDLLHTALPKQPVLVDAISGAFMFVRRSALAEVGPLDEAYFLHCEDLDWFVRFARAGWPIYFVPNVEVVHYKGACSTGHELSVAWHKHRGMSRFFSKFQAQNYSIPFQRLVYAGIWLHYGAWLAVHPFRRLLRRMRSR